MTVSRFRTILYIVAAIVALAGLADATYLSVQAFTGETLSCGGSPDCFRVLGSSYAKVGGIPVALLGALAYFTVFAFTTFAAFGYARARIFLIPIIGAMFLESLSNICGFSLLRTKRKRRVSSRKASGKPVLRSRLRAMARPVWRKRAPPNLIFLLSISCCQTRTAGKWWWNSAAMGFARLFFFLPPATVCAIA